MRRTMTALALTATLAATGCLQKETGSTIYLHTDGSFDWVVLEQRVRSDESEAGKREAEEFAYLDGIAHDSHPVAEAFRALGSRNVRTRLLRDTRPFAAIVDAGFDSLTAVVDSQLAGCGVAYDISQTVDGGVTTWRLWADIGIDGDKLADGDHCGDAIGGLTDALDLTIVLQSGTFTKAEGFTLSGSDTATLLKDEAASAALTQHDGQLVLSLSWKAAR
jgi:hypothetical protein